MASLVDKIAHDLPLGLDVLPDTDERCGHALTIYEMGTARVVIRIGPVKMISLGGLSPRSRAGTEREVIRKPIVAAPN
jgi:hypothetical protein